MFFPFTSENVKPAAFERGLNSRLLPAIKLTGNYACIGAQDPFGSNWIHLNDPNENRENQANEQS